MSKFKIGLAIILSVWVLAPTAFVGAATIAPRFNPLCWQKDTGNGSDKSFSCLDARKTLLNPNDPTLADGWLPDAECGGTGAGVEWGKCLPPGKTVASIALGGMRTFSNVGDYIKKAFQIAISVAGILAAVVIIIAGAQWTASGGNSEAIGSAKKSIAGAAIGLMLAMGSYLILNTINPALINLRLPQTYMIRQAPMPVNFCMELLDPTKFGSDKWTKRLNEAGKSSDTADQSKYANLKPADFNIQLINKDDRTKVKCGYKYFVEGGGGFTCFGGDCSNFGPDYKCFPPPITDPKEHGCKSAKIGVAFSGGSDDSCIFSLDPHIFDKEGHYGGWQYPWVKEVQLVAIKTPEKQSGLISDYIDKVVSLNSGAGDSSKRIQAFTGTLTESDLQTAKNRKGFKGFAIYFMGDNTCGGWDNVYINATGNRISRYCETSLCDFGRAFDNVSAANLISYDQLTGAQGVSIDVSMNNL